MTNLLAHSPSVYLAQHKNDPVWWFPWGEAALEAAKECDKLIFLSIGYSSCHWCHVMARESFSDSEVAAALNANFVSIKVDREQHPHIDETYMAAVEMQNGRGGWPMTLVLTPDLQPLYAAIYLPKSALLAVISQVAEAWSHQRERMLNSAAKFHHALESGLSSQPEGFVPLSHDLVHAAVEDVLADFDVVYGGFGLHPKFPPHTAIEFLLKYSTWASGDLELQARAMHVCALTLEAICLGGIFDHVEGGIHRYSVDREWHLPHFEKMLLDNALFLCNLENAIPLLPSLEALFTRTQTLTVEWLNQVMRFDTGLYASALDADSEARDGEHGEGKYYVWTLAELKEVLGTDLAEFSKIFKIEASGNFAEEASNNTTGENLLHAAFPVTPQVSVMLKKLRVERNKRPTPVRDNNALTHANAFLAIALKSSELLERVGTSILDIPRCRVGGQKYEAPALVDVGAYLLAAAELGVEVDRVEMFSTLAAYKQEGDVLFRNSKGTPGVGYPAQASVFDTPSPSGNSLVTRALIRFGNQVVAESLLGSALKWAVHSPRAACAIFTALIEFFEKIEPPLFVVQEGCLIQRALPPTQKFQEISVVVDGKVTYASEIDSIEGLPLPTIESGQTVEIAYRICDEFSCRPLVRIQLT